MRILYFSRDYTTHDHRFLAALSNTGHEIYYLRLERHGYQLEDRPLPAEVKQVCWSGGVTPSNLWQGPRLLVELSKIIRNIAPDLIHAGPLQRSAFLVALLGFRPLVSMSWGYDLFQDAGRNLLWRSATRYTLKRSSVMVGDCNTIRQIAISFGMPDERIVIFPWGVDLLHFSPGCENQFQVYNRGNISPSSSTLIKSSSAFTLLSTRSWEPIYGVEMIARAFNQASKQHPEMRLVMLGNGSQSDQIHQILKSSRVTEDLSKEPEPSGYHQVIFPGHVSYSDLPRYYRAADLYIAASHSDGTSISLLEAMACGCPVLVSDIPGNREWVTTGKNGWLFPDGDVNALTNAILHAVSVRNRLPAMGRAAQRLAEERADWNKNFQELLRAYEIAIRTHLQ